MAIPRSTTSHGRDPLHSTHNYAYKLIQGTQQHRGRHYIPLHDTVSLNPHESPSHPTPRAALDARLAKCQQSQSCSTPRLAYCRVSHPPPPPTAPTDPSTCQPKHTHIHTHSRPIPPPTHHHHNNSSHKAPPPPYSTSLSVSPAPYRTCSPRPVQCCCRTIRTRRSCSSN